MRVTRPLAIVFYQNLLPGSRLAGRLSDLGWRVLEAKRGSDLPTLARSEKPLVVILELGARPEDRLTAIAELRQAPETSHVPVLGYCDPGDESLCDRARQSGVTLVAAEAGLLDQLPRLLDHVLAVD